MKKRRFVALMIGILFLMTGCSKPGQVDREQEKWKRLGIGDYQITIMFYENFANGIETQREVTVEDGQVVDASCVSDKCPAFALADIYTVDDLFAVARGSTLASLGMLDDYKDCVQDLEFDETFGFPKSMRIDCPDAADEEHTFQVISFSPSPTVTPQPPTITPTFPGTFKMDVHGRVYDETTSHPIEGARIRYVVVHSYFPEIQEGWPNETVSDEQGQFSMPMIVHDTDNIRIVVEAPGYGTYEQKLDLFGDRSLDIGLTPALSSHVPLSKQQVTDIVWQALDPNTSSHNQTAWEIISVQTVTGREVQDLFEGEPVSGGCVPGPMLPANASIALDGFYWYVEMQRSSATPQSQPTELSSPTAPPNVPEPFVYQAHFLVDAITGQVTARKLFCVIY
jgi:hypothetical protein